jgi:hypothetical protein
MSDRVSDLEVKVAELSESLRRMEGRVGLLERGLSPAAARRVRAAAAGAAAPASDAASAMLRQDAASVAGTVSLAGRTLLVLAGAFFLRALTDTGRVPTWLGVGMGFVYAGIWVAAADRAAGRRLLASAGFHGAAAVAIGFPLLFEATARFKLLPTWLAAVLLTAFTAVALAVAARRKFQMLAWLVVLAAIPAAYALMVAQGRIAAPLLFLVLLGGATVWLGYVLDWHGPRWPVAAAADLAVLFLAFDAVRPGAVDGPVTAVLVQFALMAAYLGSTAVRTLGLRRSVVPFEMVQAAAVLLAGLGGAAFVTARAGMGAGALGALSLAFGAASYAIAFSFVERERTPANFYFYTTAGLAFGRREVHPPFGAVWSQLRTAVDSSRVRRPTRAPAQISRAAGQPTAVDGSGRLAAWALGFAPVGRTLDRVPRVVVLVVLATAVAGLFIGWIVPAVAGGPGAGTDPGIVATVRTIVLAVGALALAAMGRLPSWSDARWLAWPVLALAGVKMVVEDLPRSRPATLFLAFALYGAALILVPRLRRRAPRAEQAGA